jgi:hypothetical protein
MRALQGEAVHTWSFSKEAAAEKHIAQLQHNMLVAGTRKSVPSIINDTGKWIELSIEADPIYQTSHGIRAKSSKSGAVSFDLVEMEASHA